MLAQYLEKALKENEYSLNQQTQQLLIDYLNLLLTWNRVFNLTSIVDPREMVYLHIIDSLSVQSLLQGKHMLDVGTGAGLPGIPLAIIHPEQQWMLLDKNNKKTRFLTQVVAELKLPNVQVVHNRAEDFHTEHCFDSILSRALGTIQLFVETTEHLLCDNGVLIAMKGKYPEAELNEIPKHFSVSNATRLSIKGFDIERHAICLRKNRMT